MADNFDVIVDFSTNEEGNRRVLQDANTLERELKEIEEQAKKTGKTMDQVLDAQLEHLRTYVDGAVTGYGKIKEAQRDQAAEAAKSARAQASIFSTQASLISSQARQFSQRAEQFMRLSSRMGEFSRLALVGGGVAVGGIFKLASDYIENAEEATELTIKWKQAQDKLTESTSRIGKTAAEVALPILEEVAKLAERAATFIETHPELVTAALNAGLITAGLGALGMLVSKGVKLYADVLYLQAVPLQQEAARLQLLASEQMLVAARLQAEATGADVLEDVTDVVPGGKGLAGKLGPIAALIGDLAVFGAAIAGAAVITDKVFDHIEKRDVQFADYVTTFKQALAVDAFNFGERAERMGFFGGALKLPEGTGEEWFRKVATALGLIEDPANKATEALTDLTLSLENSKNFERILSVYEKYQADDLQLVRDHNEERAGIVSEGLKEEQEAHRRYNQAVVSVNANTAKQLTKLQRDYDAASEKAEQELANRRAEILRGAGEEALRVEEELQETLRKNRLEHADRTADLLQSRDAVGLIKENQRFERQQAEERRNANLEIRRIRQETGRRLQELEVQFEQERAARYQEFVQRAIEIKQQAAERLREMALQHQEELKRIREQTASRLREADAQFIAERRRRYEYFLQQIRDLDAALLGERQLRINRQNQMIQDLDAFLAKYRAGLATLSSSLPGKAEGGYVSGIVRTGEKGYEWVATHTSVKTAENIIGGRLTQEVFLQAMRSLRAGTNATYVDQRRFDQPLSKDQLSLSRETAIEVLSNIIGGTA